MALNFSFCLAKLSKSSITNLLSVYNEMAQDVLGLDLEQGSKDQSAAPFIDMLVTLRNDLRAKKEWELADKIRDEMVENNVVIEDGKEGTRWRFSG